MFSFMKAKPSSAASVADIERGLIARYLERILSRSDLPPRSARFILYWTTERSDVLNLTLPKKAKATSKQIAVH